MRELNEGCAQFKRISFGVRLLHFQSISTLSNVHFVGLVIWQGESFWARQKTVRTKFKTGKNFKKVPKQ